MIKVCETIAVTLSFGDIAKNTENAKIKTHVEINYIHFIGWEKHHFMKELVHEFESSVSLSCKKFSISGVLKNLTYAAFHLFSGLSQTSSQKKEQDWIPLDLDPELKSWLTPPVISLRRP